MTTPQVNDVTESFQYDVSYASSTPTFELTDVAYDVVIDDLPFIVSVSNQNPYRRETAQYRKDQFDNSTEPGEQSLTGWWLRSQTSWHNGAGITYYEPGTDAAHVTHRFDDSRGIDVWTPGAATLLSKTFHSYSGGGDIVSVAANDGTNDILVTGDTQGALKKIVLNDDNVAIPFVYSLFTTGITTPPGHNSAYKFTSVTTDGAQYFAACTKAIHRGNQATGDSVIYHLGSSPIGKSIIKFVKDTLLFGAGRTIYNLDPASTAKSQHDSTSSLPTTNNLVHPALGWEWDDIVAGNNTVYASGHNNSISEIWRIPFDDGSLGTTTPTYDLYLPAATQAVTLPFGERVESMYYYLGYLAIGTSKGIRIATVQSNGGLVLGPLLVETDYPVTGFVANDKYIWASTTVDVENDYTHAILIRIDLSTAFEDGTFPYAYDLEYESSIVETFAVINKSLTSNVATVTTAVNHEFKVGETVIIAGVDATFNGEYTITATTGNTISYAKTASDVTSTVVSPPGTASNEAESSVGVGVHYANNRLHLIVNEGEESGEIQTQSLSKKRSTGWLTTGRIRYATIEPKFFRYINVQCTTGQGDTVQVSVIPRSGATNSVAILSEGLSNQDVLLSPLSSAQEYVAFKFTLNNATDDQELPVLEAYQIKAVPATRRQRLYQYPLSCFDTEMDKWGVAFGYKGRSSEYISRLEAIEETGRFVTVNDYRTGEQYEGVIEEVRFTNESSPDKNENGFGGLLTVTVRKL